jgi:hypothetical protein
MGVFHRKAIIFCTLVFCVLHFVGCEKAPQQDVKEDSQTEKLSSEKYVSMDVAKEQLKEIVGKTIDGFSFPETIEMPDVRKVSEIELVPWYPEREKDLKKAVKKLWGGYFKVDWSNSKSQKVTSPVDNQYYGFQNEDTNTDAFYSYDSRGLLCGDSMVDMKLNASDCVAEFDFEWGDTATEKDVYSLEDGEISVPKAVSYTESLLNKQLSLLEKEQFTYKVQHLYVMKNEETGFFHYNMVIGRIYQGISIDTSTDFELTSGNYYDVTHCGIHMVAIMKYKNSLDYFNSYNELFQIGEKQEKDKIISPIWALNAMEKQIAHINGLSFSDCGLFYLVVQDNKLAEKKQQDVYQGVDNPSQSKTYLRPLWLFLSDDGSGVFDAITKDKHGTSVLVDAIDGTLYYYQETGAY